MSNQEMCGVCDGTGKNMPEGCELCGHDGWIDDLSDGGTMTCPECDGDADEDCPNCLGDGVLDE